MTINFKDQKEKYYLIRSIFMIILVLSLGFLAINQGLGFFYKVHFLKAPCDICRELNPNQSECITDCFKINLKTYQDQFGNWKDAEGTCWESGQIVKCKGFDFSELNINDLA